MHPSVRPLAAVLRLNTELLLNCLAGLDDAAAIRRVTPSTNSIAFLVAHLTDSRHYIATLLGAPTENPLAGALAGGRSLDDLATLPPLAVLTAAWERISAHLAVEIERLDTPALAAATALRFPGGDGTVLGALAFLVQHDSYHLGQLALLRRQLGYPAMSYSIMPREPGRAGA
jgi:uncharacterized damage-inducible protein DinB